MWSMTDTSVERLREELYELCGRSIACRRAVDYYIALLQNPCYPPADKMTYKMRKFYMEIIERYGLPPRCDVKALVTERLRGTVLEKYASEAAELADLVKKQMRITSRVAAVAAVIAVAEAHGVKATRESIAVHFGASYAAARMYVSHAYRIYREIMQKKNAQAGEP